jgi:hypothetical protein
LDPAFFLAVQEQLSVLVGEPKVKAPVSGGPAARVEPPSQTGPGTAGG